LRDRFRIAGFLILVAGFFITPISAQSVEGVWRSQGYGYVFEIQGPVLKAFEITATTCVPGFAAKRVNDVAPGREIMFETKDKEIYFIRSSSTGDHKFLHQEESVADIQIDRIAKLPVVCERPTANTPLTNFEVFTRAWAENYVSFDLRHTDWNKVAAEYRPQLAFQTTPAQLFEIFENMIRPLSRLWPFQPQN